MIETIENPVPPIKPMTENGSIDSSIFHVSVRAWLALTLCGTVCYMSIVGAEVKEPLYTLVGAAIFYYFGSQQRKEGSK